MNCLTSVSVIENSIHKFSPASGHEIPQNQKRKDVEEIAALFGDSYSDDKDTVAILLEPVIGAPLSYDSKQKERKARAIINEARKRGLTVGQPRNALYFADELAKYTIELAEDEAKL